VITIFVGDVTEELSLAAKKQDAFSSLITEGTISPLNHGTYYLSIGDCLSLSTFSAFLEQADTIVYAPPNNKWTDTNQNNHSYMQQWSEFFLIYFKNRKLVLGLDKVIIPQNKAVMLNLSDTRKTDNKQLWISGCSTTHGTGVSSVDRFGEIVADTLGLQVSWLTCTGSSLKWAADQILRSDIRSGDTLVWGLTTFQRFPYYHDNSIDITHVSVWHYEQADPEFNKIIPLDRLADQDLIYQGLTSIYQVINFCNKLGVNFILLGVHLGSDHLKYLLDLPNFLSSVKDPSFQLKYFDLGDDNVHPGPKTHKWIADQILNFIKNNF
jgi:hypothetical protein